MAGVAEIWRGSWVIAYRELLRFVNERSRLISSIIQPLIFLVIFGAGFGNVIGNLSPDVNFVQFMYPGIIAMGVLTSSLFAGVSIVWDREFGFLKEILVAPIDRSAVAIGKALGGATQAIIQGVVLLVLAPIIGVKLDIGSVLLLLPFLFILAFALSAMGVALASRMKSMQGFQIVMNFLMMPMFFLSGSLFPLTGVPDWMAVLGRLDPVTYGMDPIRRIVLGATLPPDAVNALGLTIFDQVLPIGVEALILLGFGAVMLAIGVANFRRRD